MKRKLIGFLLVFLALAVPLSANAEAEVLANVAVENAGFDLWTDNMPDAWQISGADVVSRGMSGGESYLEMQLNSDGNAQVFQNMTLEPDSIYKISCRMMMQGVTGSGSAGITIESQAAGSQADAQLDGAWQNVLLYIETDSAETQTYTVQFGMGTDSADAQGMICIDDVVIEKLSEAPLGAPVYAVYGGTGSQHMISEDIKTYDDLLTPAEDVYVSWNDIGVVLCAALVFVFIYLLMTGRHAPKFAARMGSRRWMTVAFAAAFIVRIFFAMRSEGHITDLNCFRAWAAALAQDGLSGFYESGMFADYPPAYMYVLYVLGKIGSLLGLSSGEDGYKLLVQIPAVIADLALAYVFYRMAKKRLGRATGSVLSMALLFCPAIICLSAAWVQIDSVLILGLVAVLYLLHTDKKACAAMLWALMVLTKPQALILGPVLLFVLIADIAKKETRKRSFCQLGIALVGMAAVYTIVTLPMKGGQSFFYAIEKIAGTTSFYAYTAANAFNLLGLLGGNFTPNTETMLGIPYTIWGVAGIVISLIVSAAVYFKKPDRSRAYLTAGVLYMLMFTLAHNMHERYLLPAAVLMLFAAVQSDSRRMTISSMALFAVSFFNIYVTYIFKTVYIYDIVFTLGCISTLCAAAYTLYAAIAETVGFEEKKKLKIPHVLLLPPKEVSMKRAKERLYSFSPDPERKVTRKDVLIMAIISVIYAGFAFTNLGSTTIPERVYDTAQAGDIYTIDFGSQQDVSLVKYYPGYCEGSIKLEYSEDGLTFYPLEGGEIENKYRNMFEWQFNNLSFSAKAVRIYVTEGYMEIRELAFFRDSYAKEIIPIQSSVLTRNGEVQDAPYLCDEQDQAIGAADYMTEMYFDEIYHARTAYEYLEGIYPYEITHPPLGKSIITIGIRLFGFNPFGWRFMGALTGVLMLPVFYIFAKRVFKRTKWAAIATTLFAADFMHYSLTRIATIDSYSLLFILLMYLFMYEYKQHNFLKEPLSRTLVPLGLCGGAWALGAATKWICIYAGVGLFILFFHTVYQRAKEYKLAVREGDEAVCRVYKKNLTLTLLFCVAVFLIIPVLVYIISYLPYFNASDTYTLKDVWNNQVYMLTYHKNLDPESVHPYSSSVYTWIFNIRPTFFFNAEGSAPDVYGVIWCMGNPLLWISGLAAVMYLVGMRNKNMLKSKGISYITVCAAAQLLPWVLITREVFIYHFFATLPFLIMAVVYALRHISETYSRGKLFVKIFVATVCLMFLLFYPITTGISVPKWILYALQWLPTWPI